MVRGQAKVTDFHMVLGIQEDVDRLQISMNHSLLGNNKQDKTDPRDMIKSMPWDGLCNSPCEHGRQIDAWEHFVAGKKKFISLAEDVSKKWNRTYC